MNLKDRAIAAHEEQKKCGAEKETRRFAKRVEATEIDFEKRFGSHHAISPGTCDTVLAKGGLEIRAVFNDRWSNKVSYFELRGACPECGAKCYSRGVHNLEDLGKQIKEFTPQYGHRCASAIHHPTAGETLLEALRNYIVEEIPDG